MLAKKQKGFTIIEVLIVLAVAGLVLSLILLVIPSLQRSGRNNQRKQDVQLILGGISSYGLNNSGAFPEDTNFVSGLKLSYFSVTDGVVLEPLSPRETISEDPTLDKTIIANYQKCNDARNDATSYAAGYTDVVALYMIEAGSSSTAKRCQEL